MVLITHFSTSATFLLLILFSIPWFLHIPKVGSILWLPENCLSMHTSLHYCVLISVAWRYFLGANCFITFLSNAAIWLMPHPFPKRRNTFRSDSVRTIGLSWDCWISDGTWGDNNVLLILSERAFPAWITLIRFSIGSSSESKVLTGPIRRSTACG